MSSLDFCPTPSSSVLWRSGKIFSPRDGFCRAPVLGPDPKLAPICSKNPHNRCNLWRRLRFLFKQNSQNYCFPPLAWVSNAAALNGDDITVTLAVTLGLLGSVLSLSLSLSLSLIADDISAIRRDSRAGTELSILPREQSRFTRRARARVRRTRMRNTFSRRQTPRRSLTADELLMWCDVRASERDKILRETSSITAHAWWTPVSLAAHRCQSLINNKLRRLFVFISF